MNEPHNTSPSGNRIWHGSLVSRVIFFMIWGGAAGFYSEIKPTFLNTVL
jgi:hypothetical protein